jgi:DNA (cytosine-5)-methyltransferase 1
MEQGSHVYKSQSIPAAAVGSPHIRDRVWIVAYPAGLQFRRQSSSWADDARRPRHGTLQTQAQVLADAECVERHSRTREAITVAEAPSNQLGGHRWFWESEPTVGRVVNGIPNRLDRLSGLGNAIVPQVAEWIFKQIAQAEGLIDIDTL